MSTSDTQRHKESNPLISIVVPFFNEAHNLPVLYKKLVHTTTQLSYFSRYEIIMVNDGSTDESLHIAQQLAEHDSSVKIISFLRNFGHEYASLAGIRFAQGDAICIIDADLQHPPETILDFEKEFIKGYDIVYGYRIQRHRESWLKKATSACFYPIFKFFTAIDIPPNVGDFCLFSKRVAQLIASFPEKSAFVRGFLYWGGFPKKGIPITCHQRYKGHSKYNYGKLTIFALENIISFSIVPIYVLFFLSLAAIVLCGIGTIVVCILHFTGNVFTSGWPSLMSIIFLLFSFTFFFLSLLGLYIGKIFQEIKQRPQYVIDSVTNISQQDTIPKQQVHIPRSNHHTTH